MQTCRGAIPQGAAPRGAVQKVPQVARRAPEALAADPIHSEGPDIQSGIVRQITPLPAASITSLLCCAAKKGQVNRTGPVLSFWEINTVGTKKSALEFKRDLNAIAGNLERTAGEISRLAESIEDVDVVAVLHLMNQQYRDADRLRAYVDEIRSGRISRAKA